MREDEKKVFIKNYDSFVKECFQSGTADTCIFEAFVIGWLRCEDYCFKKIKKLERELKKKEVKK